MNADRKLQFIEPSNPLLNQRAEEVQVDQIASPEIQSLIDAMFGMAYGEQGDSKNPTLVGLAAPQVGVSKRVILVGVDAKGMGEKPELRAYINPLITQHSKEREEGREGCYSTDRVCGIVERYKSVTIKAYDRNGKLITETHEGFPAKVFQHEIDHLDGVRFPDRITDDSKLHWVEPEKFGEYREKWAKWDTLCPRVKWKEVKCSKPVNES